MYKSYFYKDLFREYTSLTRTKISFENVQALGSQPESAQVLIYWENTTRENNSLVSQLYIFA